MNLRLGVLTKLVLTKESVVLYYGVFALFSEKQVITMGKLRVLSNLSLGSCLAVAYFLGQFSG